jgi:hypothetical protein
MGGQNKDGGRDHYLKLQITTNGKQNTGERAPNEKTLGARRDIVPVD